MSVSRPLRPQRLVSGLLLRKTMTEIVCRRREYIWSIGIFGRERGGNGGRWGGKSGAEEEKGENGKNEEEDGET